jgi:diacylglycerol kinase family enzyme
MRATLIHNPSSGDGRPSQKRLEQLLTGAGYQVRYTSTEGKWKRALDEAGDLVVAAGGDGTVGKVIRRLAGTDTPFALLPFGTANNVAKTLGVVGEIGDIVAGWQASSGEPFDVWQASADDVEETFVEGAGGGVFADLVGLGEQLVEDADLYVGRETDRAISLLCGLVENARTSHWGVELDGDDRSGPYLAVEALNVRFAGPNVPIAPDADPGDGLLDVVLVGEDERQQVLEYLHGRLRLAAGPLPRMPVARAASVRFEVPAGIPFRVDDEMLSQTADGRARVVDIRHHAVVRRAGRRGGG